MTRHAITLDSPHRIATAFAWLKRAADLGWRVEFKAPKRSDAQNDLMWVMLGAISKQVVWYGEKLSPEEWKDVFTAALKKSRVVPGLDGGFVVLGLRTSRMSVSEMTALIDLIDAFAAQQGVSENATG
jgi:hypothetical protein